MILSVSLWGECEGWNVRSGDKENVGVVGDGPGSEKT